MVLVHCSTGRLFFLVASERFFGHFHIFDDYRSRKWLFDHPIYPTSEPVKRRMRYVLIFKNKSSSKVAYFFT